MTDRLRRLHRLLPLLAGCGTLFAGCSAWLPAAPGLRYAPTAGDVPVQSDLVASELPPESYAIGSLPAEGTQSEAIVAAIARTAARKGAHVVLMEEQEAIVARWTRVRSGDGQSVGETAREETISIDSASVRALGVGYRHPERCLGARLVCEPEPDPTRDTATCAVRVRGHVPGGPLEQAGIDDGQRIVQIEGRAVASPSDVFRSVDAAPGDVRVVVVDGRTAREVVVTPRPCSALYADPRP